MDRYLTCFVIPAFYEYYVIRVREVNWDRDADGHNYVEISVEQLIIKNMDMGHVMVYGVCEIMSLYCVNTMARMVVERCKRSRPFQILHLTLDFSRLN